MIFERATVENIISNTKEDYSVLIEKNPGQNIKIESLDIKVPLAALLSFYTFLESEEDVIEIDVTDWDEECCSDYLFKDYLWLAGRVIRKSLVKQLGLFLKAGEWQLSVAKPQGQEPLGDPFQITIPSIYTIEIKDSFSLKGNKLFKEDKEVSSNRVNIGGKAFPTKAVTQFLAGKPVDINFLFEVRDDIWYRNNDSYWARNHAGTKISKDVKICGKLIDPYKGTQEDI